MERRERGEKRGERGSENKAGIMEGRKQKDGEL